MIISNSSICSNKGTCGNEGAGSFVLPQNFHVKTDQYFGLSAKRKPRNFVFYMKADALERSNNSNMFCDIFTISRGGGQKTNLFNSMQRTYGLQYRCDTIDLFIYFIENMGTS